MAENNSDLNFETVTIGDELGPQEFHLSKDQVRAYARTTGMWAPRNLGYDYVRAFNAIFPALASTHSVGFYPFFLDGVVADPKLNQGDGLHPNGAGVDLIVERILPKVEELIAVARAARGS